MNETTKLLMKHRSIRKFTKRPVEQEIVEAIVAAGQMAATSSNVQAYSVIQVNDTGRRKQLAEWAGNQAYIEQCPVFLVWCADLYRLSAAYRQHGEQGEAYAGTTENLIVSTVDTALAAQNAAIAAESLGLGIVYIGGIRNRIAEVGELLKLPELVYPVFGMCIGYPDQQPLLRPRLPIKAVLHADEYSDEHYNDTISAYDAQIKRYMLERSAGKASSSWSDGVYAKLAKPARMHMLDYLESKGFFRSEIKK